MLEYLCPVCKHNEVEYEDQSPKILTKPELQQEGVKVNTLKYISICSNCQNVYCYKVDTETIIKPNEEEKK